MIKLEILKADGSHYWTEYFNFPEECQTWIKAEKARPYWRSDFLINFFHDDLKVPDVDGLPQLDQQKLAKEEKEKAEDEQRRAAKGAARAARLEKFSKLKDADLDSIPEIRAVILEILEEIGLR